MGGGGGTPGRDRVRDRRADHRGGSKVEVHTHRGVGVEGERKDGQRGCGGWRERVGQALGVRGDDLTRSRRSKRVVKVEGVRAGPPCGQHSLQTGRDGRGHVASPYTEGVASAALFVPWRARGVAALMMDGLRGPHAPFPVVSLFLFSFLVAVRQSRGGSWLARPLREQATRRRAR